jgi:hypothetical protein
LHGQEELQAEDGALQGDCGEVQETVGVQQVRLLHGRRH